MMLVLKSPFSSAHLYQQPLWSPEENTKTFGRCYTEHGHGHNYKLEVAFQIRDSEITEQKKELQKLLDSLTRALDHEHLNFVIPEFKTQIPTTENIALYFLNKLKERGRDKDVAYLRLYEMDNLWTEIRR
ncbi:MAG: 6-pyruvoyl tetrahydropterin synthase [Bdellovibrio sp. ArHS]|uniref:6-carboxytetrahydropterin synthase n=1 Tax=Bdellovibrio sp. ArHS TaxID=1569284 RepID=UPI000582DAA6|nr:6-carboxytetrahydropterin synthase [Bdellovibrio sp. ArHS]KHD88757.1 MAG: 6-pyruvoyl tetrahydropterin synthase [Bdellovibrio sp. ArHS]